MRFEREDTEAYKEAQAVSSFHHTSLPKIQIQTLYDFSSNYSRLCGNSPLSSTNFQSPPSQSQGQKRLP